MKMILSNLFGFIKAKPRLFIEYMMIGAVVFLCGVAAYLWSQNELNKSRLDSATAKVESTVQRLGNVEKENKKLGEAVVFLANQREKDTVSFKTLSNALASEKADHKALQDKIKNLEKSNADVKAYLNERIPDDLRRLLDAKSSAPSGAGDSQSKITSSSISGMS
ncbi:hypothetical protein OMDBNIEC_00071 [Salmonella phage STP-SP5]|nr:hypothetical protein OMDBNIEC_00071 [Salmonella phage STP-SP5]